MMINFKRPGFIKGIFFWLVLISLIGSLVAVNFGCYANTEIENKIADSQGNVVQSGTLTENDDKEFNTLEEAILSEDEKDQDENYSFAPSFSYPEVDGLHVTGTPVEIDLVTYRLKITGLVEEEIEFSFDEIKNMQPTKIYSVLNCPGFFVDKGDWTGVRISDLLNLAGLKQEAKTIRFIEAGGGYSREIALKTILDNENNFLAAYHFNDKEFPVIHGYPLRVVARGETGSLWVKWLGEIKVLE
jgi:DMSO/TMAO reductase YedYZ molybdopterin-dependent catalytic subunit